MNRGGELVPAHRDAAVPRQRNTRYLLTRAPVRAWLVRLLVPALPLSYLAAGEQVRVLTRLHWIAPARVIVRMSLLMVAVGFATWVAALVAPGVFLVQALLWGAAAVHSVMLGWRVLLWRAETIVVTDRRVYRLSGIFTITVDSVQLEQVTDVTIRHTIAGRIFDYGTLRFESAGQRQGLEQLDHVPGPGAVYRCALGHLTAP